MRPAVLAAALIVALFTVGAAGQSKTPFGIPSADTPQPGSGIKAVSGSRAQGWMAQGRSEVLARHGLPRRWGGESSQSTPNQSLRRGEPRDD